MVTKKNVHQYQGNNNRGNKRGGWQVNQRGGRNGNRYLRTNDGKPICIICNKPGHLQYTCNQLQNKNGGGNGGGNNRYRGKNNYRGGNGYNGNNTNRNENDRGNGNNQGGSRRPQNENEEEYDERTYVIMSLNEQYLKRLIIVTAEFDGISAKSFVDTGAGRIIIDMAIFTKMNGELQPYTGLPLTSANGDNIRVVGQVELVVSLKDCNNVQANIPITAVVMENAPFQALLGMGFCANVGMIVDTKRRIVYVTPINIVLNNSGKQTVHARNDLIIAPRTVTSLDCLVSKKNDIGKVLLAMTDVSGYSDTRPILTNSLVENKNGQFSVLAANFTERPIEVKAGQRVGYFEEVNEEMACSYDSLEVLSNVKTELGPIVYLADEKKRPNSDKERRTSRNSQASA